VEIKEKNNIFVNHQKGKKLLAIREFGFTSKSYLGLPERYFHGATGNFSTPKVPISQRICVQE
jgi:hypothetical protein